MGQKMHSTKMTDFLSEVTFCVQVAKKKKLINSENIENMEVFEIKFLKCVLFIDNNYFSFAYSYVVYQMM